MKAQLTDAARGRGAALVVLGSREPSQRTNALGRRAIDSIPELDFRLGVKHTDK